ncbi:hypothetical protein Sjap_015778 [Stephania japonica]|uniref:RING-type domain-containing protein n=1 Tax=Stephania japonica TaxID=461633 RepID=A0AAP0NUA8_9MAGN
MADHSLCEDMRAQGFKFSTISIEHKAKCKVDDFASPSNYKEEKEEDTIRFEFLVRHANKYYVNPNGGSPYEHKIEICPCCELLERSMKINSSPTNTRFKKSIRYAFLELFRLMFGTNHIINHHDINCEVKSLVKKAMKKANDMRREGHRKIVVRVEIAVWTNYVYDEYEAMWRAMMVSTEEDRVLGFIPASGSAIDKLKKVLSTSDLIGGSSTGGDSCTICLEDLEIDSEATRTPCFHMFHPSCIVKWLEMNNVCPLCRCKLSDDV